MSLSGYWKVIRERAEIFRGSKPTTRCPSPGADEEGGNGEAIGGSIEARRDLSAHHQLFGDDLCVDNIKNN
jgi:hypothetical protein